MVKVTVKVTVRITVRVSGRHVGWIHAQKGAREARNMPVCAIYPLRVIVASEIERSLSYAEQTAIFFFNFVRLILILTVTLILTLTS